MMLERKRPVILSLNVAFRLAIIFIMVIILTPCVRWLAFKVGAVDTPNKRRMNTKTMPSMGGLAIYLAFTIAGFTLFRYIIPMDLFFHICVGGGIIILTGILDDIFNLTPRQKMLGIILAGLYIFYFGHIRMSIIQILGLKPFILPDFLSLIFSIGWIAIITNSINLIDGLDGLASGVSFISLTTIGIVALFHFQGGLSFIPILIFMLAIAILGFLPYNFYPARIYLGDTGALFLGYMISVFSLMGLKNATLITFLTPFVILGVPLVDTFFAIIRRKYHRQPISSADKKHLHHRLISMGFTHRGAVLIIYGLSMIFSMVALIYNYIPNWALFTLTIALLFCIELFVEMIGLIDPKWTPLLHTFKFIGNRRYRLQVIANWKKKLHKKDQSS